MLDWGTYMYSYLTCFQRNKAEVDRNKLREIEEQDERLAKIIQEQEKIKLKKAKEKKKKEQEEKSRQQVKLYLKSYLSLYLPLPWWFIKHSCEPVSSCTTYTLYIMMIFNTLKNNIPLKRSKWNAHSLEIF